MCVCVRARVCVYKPTCSGCRWARSMAAWMAIDPSLVAGKEERAPRKLPTGVRTALAIRTSLEPFPRPRAAELERRRRRAGTDNLLLLQNDAITR